MPMTLKEWVLISTVTCDADEFNRNLFVENLGKAAIAYGITISKPYFLSLTKAREAQFI